MNVEFRMNDVSSEPLFLTHKRRIRSSTHARARSRGCMESRTRGGPNTESALSARESEADMAAAVAAAQLDSGAVGDSLRELRVVFSIDLHPAATLQLVAAVREELNSRLMRCGALSLCRRFACT
jgi:hypothetical protein